MYDPPPQDAFEAYELFLVAKWAGVPAWELAQAQAVFYEGYRDAMWIEHLLNAEAMRKHATGQ